MDHQVSIERVRFGDGHLTVRDHGGRGPAVVFVHSVGTCALNWGSVPQLLSDRCRSYTFDLPGHGQSGVELTSWDQAWRAVPAIVDALVPDRPLLVGHDTGAWYAMLALIDAPDRYRGGIGFGGSVARSRAEAAEMVDFARSDVLADSVRKRFRFGERGRGEESAAQLVQDVTAASARDWITGTMADLRDELQWSIRYAEDGSWVHRPRPETIRTAAGVPETSPAYPDEALYARLRLPWWLVHLEHGFDVADAAQREGELVAHLPGLRRLVLDSGPWPQYTHPGQVADIVAAVAADPSRQQLPLAAMRGV